MIELLIVTALVVTIAAIAFPTVTKSITIFKMKSAMSEVSGLIQNCRSNAVRKSKIKALHFSTKGSQTVIFTQDCKAVDSTGTGCDTANIEKMATSEDQIVYLPDGFKKVDSGAVPVVLEPSEIWNSTTTTAVASTDMAFNARGLPCDPNYSPCETMKGFIYYLSYAPGGSTERFAAATISPMGRIKMCSFNEGSNEWMSLNGAKC